MCEGVKWTQALASSSQLHSKLCFCCPSTQYRWRCKVEERLDGGLTTEEDPTRPAGRDTLALGYCTSRNGSGGYVTAGSLNKTGHISGRGGLQIKECASPPQVGSVRNHRLKKTRLKCSIYWPWISDRKESQDMTWLIKMVI